MITKEQVEKFLEDFSLKVKIFGIRFRDDRQKNQNSLVELGITPNQRMEVIMNLSCYDCSEGPIVDALNNQGEMWVFGKDVREMKSTSRLLLESRTLIPYVFRFIKQNILCLTP